jgi:hypothetical protein
MEQNKETVPVGDLSVIEDIDKLNLAPTFVLIRVIQKKSSIIMPDTIGLTPKATFKIIKIGDKVEKVDVGNVAVDLKNEKAGVYYYKKGEDTFMLTDQYNLLLWTTDTNYKVD